MRVSKRPLTWIVIVTGALAWSAGCKKAAEPEAPDLAKKTAESVLWPEKPADGAPVAARFVRMIGEGKRRGAEVQLFNFAAQHLLDIDLVLIWVDADGKELGRWPQRARSKRLVAKGGQATMSMGSHVPVGTTAARLTVRRLGFEGGIDWTRP